MIPQFSICNADELRDLVTTDPATLHYVISLEYAGTRTAPRLGDLDAKWIQQQLVLPYSKDGRDAVYQPAPGDDIVQAALDHHRLWAPRDGKPIHAIMQYPDDNKDVCAAIVLILLRHQLGAGSELAALQELFRIQQIAAKPNLALVRHGDRLLGCNGKLIATLEKAAVSPLVPPVGTTAYTPAKPLGPTTAKRPPQPQPDDPLKSFIS